MLESQMEFPSFDPITLIETYLSIKKLLIVFFSSIFSEFKVF